MAQVVVALGASLSNKSQEICAAQKFLESLSSLPAKHSSLYETEAVGPSENIFINAVSVLETELEPYVLLEKFKEYESGRGRDHTRAPWTDREIDLDIIAYNSLVLKSQRLTIPHPLYHCRRFVLVPLQELLPNWCDPQSQQSIDRMISQAKEMAISKSESKC